MKSLPRHKQIMYKVFLFFIGSIALVTAVAVFSTILAGFVGALAVTALLYSISKLTK
jgi:hypothetical protein